MRPNWLHSRFGTNFVAIGLVAAVVAVAVIAFQDVSFLATGVWPKLPWYREVLYHLVAAVAAIFSGVSFFVFRPGLPRFVAAVVAMSYGSYVVQPFAHIQINQLTSLCLVRLTGFCTLLLLVRTYLADVKAGRVAR